MTPRRLCSASPPVAARTFAMTSANSSDNSRSVASSSASLLPKWKLMDAAVCPAALAIFADVSEDRPCSEIAAIVALIRSSFEPSGLKPAVLSRLAAMERLRRRFASRHFRVLEAPTQQPFSNLYGRSVSCKPMIQKGLSVLIGALAMLDRVEAFALGVLSNPET